LFAINHTHTASVGIRSRVRFLSMAQRGRRRGNCFVEIGDVHERE
jgi:hypothetical protein